MISTRAQLRIVAFFYAAVVALVLGWFTLMRTAAPSASPGSIPYELAQRAANALPLVAVTAIFYLALSCLSLRFLALSRSWQVATIAGSLLASLSQVSISVRDTLIVTPKYLNLGLHAYGYLAVELGVFWGRASAFVLCSYLLWKQMRDSNNRFERSRVAS